MHNSDAQTDMLFGYARVSTDRQDLAAQVAQLSAAGVGADRIYREKISGRTADRPQLQRVIKALQPGDALVVVAVDRLARDTRDLLNILHDVKQAGAGFRSLNEPIVDTTSELADVVIAVLGITAKWERARLLERTAVGLAHAKAQGVKLGPKFSLTPHQQREALERLAAGEPQRAVARSYNVSQSTISRLLKVNDFSGEGGSGSL